MWRRSPSESARIPRTRREKCWNNYPSFETVKEKVHLLEGDILQRPGIFSAIKKDGRPMYQLARKGETVEIPARPVHVESILPVCEMKDHGVLMTVRCGRGTYIRSICEDLGKLCGCPAHMRFLLRSASGVFDLKTAMTLEEAAEFAGNGTLGIHILPPDMPLGHMPYTEIREWAGPMVRSGAKLPPRAATADLPVGTVTRIYLSGQFWGIAERAEDGFVWRAQIAPEEANL